MPGSTYSTNLKIELMTTGENSGTWGDITNTNLGTALEQAVIGYGNVDYVADANLTISITNSNASQPARALVLNVTSAFGALTQTRELVVPTSQKQYIVQNNTTGGQSITVKTSAGTGITVPNGRKAHLYVNGTNVIQMFDFINVLGGTIDNATLGATTASSARVTTLNASGAATLDGTVALGNAAGDLITVPGTINSNLLFTDNTYDIGATGATRPRNLFLAGAATIGGNLSVGGTLTLTGGVNLNGNVTVGDSAADTLTINATITSNLIFTDNTYDIGASGATRPRNLFLAGNATIGGAQTLTGALTVDSTTNSTSATTGSIQTDGGIGLAKDLYVGGSTTLGDASADTVTVNGTVTSNLIFTDNTYDIGASGATRPRNLYLAGLLTMGGALTVNGNTTLGDASGDTLTINGTAVSIPNSLNFDSNTLFIDATNNRVGVLTNAPDYELSVVGSGSFGGVGSNLGVIVTPLTSSALPSSSVKSVITSLNSGFGYSAGSLYIQPRTGVGAVLVLGTEGVERMEIGSSEAVFNDPGNDVDFRVESDTSTHMLFVDAGNNCVGINDSVPHCTLAVDGVIGSQFYSNYGGSGVEDAFGRKFVWTMANSGNSGATWRKIAIVTLPNASFCSLGLQIVTINPGSNYGLYTNTETRWINQANITRTSGATVIDTAYAFGPANSSRLRLHRNSIGEWELQGNAGGDNEAVMYEVTVLTSGGGASVASVEGQIAGTTGGTLVQFDGTRVLTDNFSNVITYGGSVFNEGGLAADFRVESDTNTVALFLNGTTSRVGINTSTLYQSFTVNGAIEAGSTGATNGTVTMYAPYNGNENDYLGLWGTQFSSGGPTMAYGLASSGSTNWNSTYDNFSGSHSVLVLDGPTLRFLSDASNTTTTTGSAVTVYERMTLGRSEAVFNDDSRDVDFRVESDTNTHALFVDAGNSAVLLNQSTTSAIASGILQISNGAIVLYKNATLADNGTMDICIGQSNICYWGGFLSVLVSDQANGGSRTQTNFSVIAENQFQSFSTSTIHTVNGSIGGRTFTLTYVDEGTIRLTNTSGSTCVCTMSFFGGGANLG
jgi:hypothetical protein